MISETWNPKSEIWIWKSEIPETWNAKSETWNMVSGSENFKSEVGNMKSYVWNLESRTGNLKSEVVKDFAVKKVLMLYGVLCRSWCDSDNLWDEQPDMRKIWNPTRKLGFRLGAKVNWEHLLGDFWEKTNTTIQATMLMHCGPTKPILHPQTTSCWKRK